MKATDYLKEKLILLFTEFKEEGLMLKYGCEEDINLHIIEVLPFKTYKKNKDYRRAQLKLKKDFYKSYPSEDIAFVSTGSLIEVDHFQLQLGYETKKQKSLVQTWEGLQFSDDIPEREWVNTAFSKELGLIDSFDLEETVLLDSDKYALAA